MAPTRRGRSAAPTSTASSRNCAQTPGVESATATMTATPPYIGFETPFETRGQARPDPNQTTLVGVVGGDYFSTLRIPLLRGRDFSEQDLVRAKARRGAQRGHAARVLPEARIRSDSSFASLPCAATATGPSLSPPQAGEWLEIIGVVASARNRGLAARAAPGDLRSVYARAAARQRVHGPHRGRPAKDVQCYPKPSARGR